MSAENGKKLNIPPIVPFVGGFVLGELNYMTARIHPDMLHQVVGLGGELAAFGAALLVVANMNKKGTPGDGGKGPTGTI